MEYVNLRVPKEEYKELTFRIGGEDWKKAAQLAKAHEDSIRADEAKKVAEDCIEDLKCIMKHNETWKDVKGVCMQTIGALQDKYLNN